MHVALLAGYDRQIGIATADQHHAVGQLHLLRSTEHAAVQRSADGTVLQAAAGQKEHLAALGVVRDLKFGIALRAVCDRPVVQFLDGGEIVEVFIVDLCAGLAIDDRDLGRSGQDDPVVFLVGRRHGEHGAAGGLAGDLTVLCDGRHFGVFNFISKRVLVLRTRGQRRRSGDCRTRHDLVLLLSEAQGIADELCGRSRSMVVFRDADVIHIDGVAVFAGVVHRHDDDMVDLRQLVAHTGVGQLAVHIGRSRHAVRGLFIHGLDRVPRHVLIASHFLAGLGIFQLRPTAVVRRMSAVGIQADELAVLRAERRHEQEVGIRRERDVIGIRQLVVSRGGNVLQRIGQELMRCRLFVHAQRQHMVALQIGDLRIDRFRCRRAHRPACRRCVRADRSVLKIEIQNILLFRLLAAGQRNLEIVQIDRAGSALEGGQERNNVLGRLHPTDTIFHGRIREFAVHIGPGAPALLRVDIVRADGVPDVRRVGTEVREGFAVLRDLQLCPAAGLRLIGKRAGRIHGQTNQLAGVPAERRQIADALFAFREADPVGHADLLVFAAERIGQDHMIGRLRCRRIHFQRKNLVFPAVFVQLLNFGSICLRSGFGRDFPPGIRCRCTDRLILKIEVQDRPLLCVGNCVARQNHARRTRQHHTKSKYGA